LSVVRGVRWTLSTSGLLCRRLFFANLTAGLDVDTMASLYDTELTVMLDRAVQAPAHTVTRRPRPSDPWFDAECRAAKRLTRRLERAAIADAKKPDTAVAANANQVWQTQRLTASCGIKSSTHSVCSR